MPEYNVDNTEQEKSLNFDAIKIGLASPEKIREWSHGEVKRPETINYRTLKPEKDGLFCEKIFGPQKDWECNCGKYKKIRFKGVVCDKCGVEVTKSSVRRERMGHIELAAPVSHIWYFKGIPSRMGLILDISPRILEKVLYFSSYIVTDPKDTPLAYKQILNEQEYRDAEKEYGFGSFVAEMGAEAIQKLLMAIDLDKESEELKKELETCSGQKRTRIIKRLEVMEAFRTSENRPEWMIMNVIPVIPPDIRPMVQLEGGRFATSDLNDLYRRIINRNNRLRRLLDLGAPEIIVRNEKRMLQEAVDALIDNGRRGRAVTGPGNRALKSLSEMLKGKQGRFRQNLLGKRVDYSGRSVIVVGPELKIYQCGLPKEMAIELFKPFVMKELTATGKANNIKQAKKMVEKLEPQVWDILEDVIKEHPVMLNRAPTLHRLGIQAFEPVLVGGKAIKLHPLVCTAFNADFDGDQMAVHLPLTVEAQAECRFLLLSPNNLLKPSDGATVAVPSQDMILGIYYLTLDKDGEIGEGKYFKSKNEAILAYENKVITLHSKIHVRRTVEYEGQEITGVIDTTLGKMLFNEIIPQDLGFVDRSTPENALRLEIEKTVGKKQLKPILDKCINTHGATKTAEVLDDVKAIGYKFSTRGAISVSISDMKVPDEKKDILDDAQKRVDEITKRFRRGMGTEEERYQAVVKVWEAADKHLQELLFAGLDKYNNIFMMADSGARGSNQQIKQLAGMRGLMADTTGRTIELPIKSNFREGLDVLEYFISAHGARKGLSDTALRTADSGYLTRRLVDVSQDLIIREPDCSIGRKEIPGMVIEAFREGKEMIEEFQERITGRYLAESVYDAEGNMLVKINHMVTAKRAELIVNKGVDSNGVPFTVTDENGERKVRLDAKIKIRTVLTCKSHLGVCAKCYGANMATGLPVQVGESVGIIAAQSIGEPGTQLTMRTFHTGGIASAEDITQGLPRVEELFESRRPKGAAIITRIDGVVRIEEVKKTKQITVTSEDTENPEQESYAIPYGYKIRVREGQAVTAGEPLTEGSINPADILAVNGPKAVQNYIITEVQKVYRLQGVDINDKHIEVIVRQMMRKVKIDDSGSSYLLPGSLIDRGEVARLNEEIQAQIDAGDENARLITTVPVLQGITKASSYSDSFLSAASFQETTKALTDAAIRGKTDKLMGLKENVIIGKLIPAGTGMDVYNNVQVVKNESAANHNTAETPLY